MLRYRLDDLGWFHFEKIVQSLLKAHLGLAVESWGGRGDFGRDAFCREALPFPHPQKPGPGPFVFQVKFVQAANAAGAKPEGPLLKAIYAEARRLEERKARLLWQDPSHYVLLTNAPLTSRLREKIQAQLGAVLPLTSISSLGASDLSDLLDQYPRLRHSFPEILSLRDLDLLLSKTVNRAIITRSRVALAETRDLVPLFVPTQAFHQAQRKLRKHHMIVLDGPPEMGKTAIARVLSLIYLLDGWEAIDCRDPDDFFAMRDTSCKQTFVADDAFGRTEFDPSLGRKWERDLPRVLLSLDTRHRLILTTRKHILIRALRELDLTGKARTFPSPGEVTVTANALLEEEKARILYRHARAENLPRELCDLIREYAESIIRNTHFTPERVRRLVADRIPRLLPKGPAIELDNGSISKEIKQVLQNPTDRMRKSFRKLRPSHKGILLGLLDSKGLPTREALEGRVSVHYPKLPPRTFGESLEDLLGTFLRTRSWYRGKVIDWIHPSVRDLIIDELASNSTLRARFLDICTVVGIKLALSSAGGELGDRNFPLLATEDDWDKVTTRCLQIAKRAEVTEALMLLDALATCELEDLTSVDQVQAIESLEFSVCNAVLAREDSRTLFSEQYPFETYLKVASRLDPSPPLPEIGSLWSEQTSALEIELAAGGSLDPNDLSSWRELRDLVLRYYRDMAVSPSFREKCEDIKEKVFVAIRREVADQSMDIPTVELDDEASRLDQLAFEAEELDTENVLGELVDSLHFLADDYRSEAPSDEPDWQGADEGFLENEAFSIRELFEDL